MKIDPSPRINSTPTRRAGKGRASASASNFAGQLTPAGEETARPAVAASPVAVNPLLSVQEVTDATTGTARAKAQAEAMLDHLDELRMGLLAGSVPRDRLAGLVRLAKTAREPNLDSRLGAVLDEIELRAKVELAKLDLHS